MRSPRLVLLVLLAVLVKGSTAGASAPPAALGGVDATVDAGLPPIPRGWPALVHVGLADELGDARALRSVAPLGFRYRYLAGGANTGRGWAGWQPDGALVPAYIRESVDHGFIPVFSYAMLRESRPGVEMDEAAGDWANLQNGETMAAWYADLRRFYRLAGQFSEHTVVLQVEADLWGHLHRRAGDDDATKLPAMVSATGVNELAGLPNTVAGFAQAVTRLRDRYAPNVLVAYHLSPWGTNVDLIDDAVTDATAGELGERAARFFTTLGAKFDLAFTQAGIIDAGYRAAVHGDGGSSWWGEGAYRRHAAFFEAFVRRASVRLVLWQLPLGNTVTPELDGSPGRYRDNHVEWLLGDPTGARPAAFVRAGVVAFLFGPAEPDTTSTATDGGYFFTQAARYYAAGPLTLSAPSGPSRG